MFPLCVCVFALLFHVAANVPDCVSLSPFNSVPLSPLQPLNILHNDRLRHIITVYSLFTTRRNEAFEVHTDSSRKADWASGLI